MLDRLILIAGCKLAFQDSVTLNLANSDGWCSHRCEIILEVLPPLAVTLLRHALHVGYPSSSKRWPTDVFRYPKNSQTVDFVFLDGGGETFGVFTSVCHHTQLTAPPTQLTDCSHQPQPEGEGGLLVAAHDLRDSCTVFDES